jgi:hypothetical protein
MFAFVWFVRFGGTFAVSIPLLCIIAQFLRNRSLASGSLTCRQGTAIVLALFFVFAACVPAAAALARGMWGYYRWHGVRLAPRDLRLSVDQAYEYSTGTAQALAGALTPAGDTQRFDAFEPRDGTFLYAYGAATTVPEYALDARGIPQIISVEHFYAVPMVGNTTGFDVRTRNFSVWCVTQYVAPSTNLCLVRRCASLI